MVGFLRANPGPNKCYLCLMFVMSSLYCVQCLYRVCDSTKSLGSILHFETENKTFRHLRKYKWNAGVFPFRGRGKFSHIDQFQQVSTQLCHRLLDPGVQIEHLKINLYLNKILKEALFTYMTKWAKWNWSVCLIFLKLTGIIDVLTQISIDTKCCENLVANWI